MSEYICLSNFKDGKDDSGRGVRYVSGQPYEGENGPALQKAGLVKPLSEIVLDKVSGLQAQIEAKKQEIKDLELKISNLEASVKGGKPKGKAKEPAKDSKE